MLRTDMNLRFAMEYRAVAEQYLANEDLFFADFTAAWTKIMNQDRFDLTISEEDNTPSNDSGDDDDDISNTSVALIFGFVGAAIGVLITALAAHFVIYAPKSPSDGLKSPLNNDRGSVTDLRSSSYIPPVRPSEVGETL
jgi:hypothetical protein